MTDHLPECPHRVDHPTLPKNRELICICPELRACEQRVVIEGQRWHRKRGYAAGLDAAEADLCAAAEREKQERDLDDLYDGIRYSIERVRALKEKP